MDIDRVRVFLVLWERGTVIQDVWIQMALLISGEVITNIN